MAAGADVSLADARRTLLEEASAGTICPCCDRYIRIYKRAITPAMAKVLKLLADVSHTDESYHQVQTLIASSADFSPEQKTSLRGDFAKLRFWRLIGSPPEGYLGKPEKKWTGYWRVTELGREFVSGKTRVQKYRYLFKNGELDAEVLETVSFEEALRGRRPVKVRDE